MHPLKAALPEAESVLDYLYCESASFESPPGAVALSC